MSSELGGPDGNAKTPVHRGLAVPVILAALYVPQSWYFLMDYPWNSYRLFWLKLFPMLPVFYPFALFGRKHETLALILAYATTAGCAAGLYIVSRRSTFFFYLAAILMLILSSISAAGAYSIFRM